MLRIIVCLSALVIACNAQLHGLPIARALGSGLGHAGLAGHEGYEPYQYGYTTSDEFGTQWSRSETADGNGHVRGSYSYREANGIGRTVEYVVDPVNGFQANVVTNEPGTISHAPAAAVYRSANQLH